jgi:SpoVK/Ycf46/Vps4 family AAA+-type ATPase
MTQTLSSPPSTESQRTFDFHDLVALWLLRWFSTERARRALFRRKRFFDDDLARAMGLEELADEEVEPEACGAILSRKQAELEQRHQEEPLDPSLRKNFEALGRLLGLSAEETEVVRFFAILVVEDELVGALRILSAQRRNRLEPLFERILGPGNAALRAAFDGRGPLHETGVLRIEEYRFCDYVGPVFFSEDLARDLVYRDLSDGDILQETVRPTAPPTLGFADYPHLASSLALLRPFLARALRERRPGVNVFLHGPAGTGKTELSRLLGADAGAQVHELASAQRQGKPLEPEKRLERIRLATRLLGPDQILVIDEAEDLFPQALPLALGGGRASTVKAWLHRTLETNPLPVIWIANDTGGVDAAQVRRFSFFLEVPVPPRSQRQLILERASADLVSPATTARLSASEHLAPAVVERAAEVLSTTADHLADGPARDTAFVRLVNQTLRAQGLPRVAARTPDAALPDLYRADYLNCRTNPAALASSLARHPSASLCLYGPSGTGKTTYAHWLARALDRPVHAHRASDLLSAYLGASEQNIARAFLRAEEHGALLLIDEIDSFLRDRTTAEHSWQISQTNELLTQMESFDGIFVAATNLFAELDAATVRRFDLKLFFDALRPDQATRLLRAHCEALGLPAPTPEQGEAVGGLAGLTVGDFATVTRRARLHPVEDPAAFLACLREELAHKKDGPRRGPLGFQAT